MLKIILIILGSIFAYHLLFSQQFCKENVKNYLVLKVKEKKCYRGLTDLIIKKESSSKSEILPPWAK
jgi:hypothetical protein